MTDYSRISKESTIAVGISGGVDSAVAAYLLKQQGFKLIGIFMINWKETEGTLSGECPWEEDQIFAKIVAKQLDIPLHIVDLSEDYRQRVVDYMFREYEAGRTPNPDVLCNREIKFDVCWDAAKKLGADYIATGHYCRKETIDTESGEIHRLLAGVDPSKDQSYFLCQLSQEQLKHALFPIGDLQKSEVREIADSLKLAPAKRKDSQGICFVGKVDLPVFLQQKLSAQEGDIIEIPFDANIYEIKHNDLYSQSKPYKYSPEMGKVVGKHHGAHFFTIGQRKGINVGGKAEPLFVIATDTENNILYVGQGDSHPGLYRSVLFIAPEDIHFIRPDYRLLPSDSRKFQVRIRYRQPLQDATLHQTEEGLYICFDTPQRGVTSGQFAAWYDGEEEIGSGVIG